MISQLRRCFHRIHEYAPDTQRQSDDTGFVAVQIRRLEQLLGVRLLDRQARGVTLTAAGERLCRSAVEILQLLDTTAACFKSEPLHALIRVGIPDHYGADLLTDILAEFGQRNANVNVEKGQGHSLRSEHGLPGRPRPR